MPTDTEQDETSTTPATQDAATTTTAGEKPDADPFDADRAKALIDKLRPFEKRATQLEKDLEAANRKLQAIEDEKLSETERLQKRVADLEAFEGKAAELTGELETTNAALASYVETLREGVPDHVLVLLDDKPLAAQLEWLAKNRDSVATAKTEQTTKGVPATPKANTSGIPEDERRRRAANTVRGV